MKHQTKRALHWNDISVNVKLLVSFLFCIMIPLLVLNTLYFARINESIYKERITVLDGTVASVADDVRDLFADAISIGDSLSMDKTFLKYLGDSDMNPSEYYTIFLTQLLPRLRPYAQLYDQYSSLCVYANNSAILNGSGLYNLNVQREREIEAGGFDWYTAYRQSGRTVFVYQDWGGADASGMPTVGVVYRLGTGNALATEMYLRAEISKKALSGILTSSMQDMALTLQNENGAVLCFTGDTDAHGEMKTGAQSVVSVEVPLGANLPVWRLTGVAEQTETQDATDTAQVWFVLVALVSIGVALLFYSIIYRSYNKRINELLEHMAMAEHHQFHTIDDVQIGSDEIGQLVSHFNTMTDEINQLVNNVHVLEMQRKDMEIENIRAEMLRMQSQMDPHFIYNTLSAMMVVSLKENYPKLVDIIYYLSRLLRRMVDRTEDDVSVNEELIFTEMYLKIEKFRFQSQFEYHIETQKEASLMMIPKFTIQPLVENACKHGIRQNHRQGNVWVDVRTEDGKLMITVRDDGVGFKPEQLEEILRSMKSDEQIGSSVGLRNIFRRLQFEFGEDSKMEIYSTPEVGTRIDIRIAVDRLRRIEEEDLQLLEPGGGILK